MPTVGTNTTASSAWWYTAYFIRGTAVYWTGSGRVTITETTSTGENGLVWQEILPPGSLYTETDEIALAALYGTNTILEAAITNEAALRKAHTEDTGNPHGVTAVQIGALTAEVDPVAGPRLDRIEAGTNAWHAAYSWGDHALAGYLLPADLAPYATTQQVAEAVSGAVTNLNLYAVPVVGGKHELWVKE
jgi:hypothetical protein